MVLVTSREGPAADFEVLAMTTQTTPSRSILKRGALLAGAATLGIGLEVEQARLAHANANERLAVSARAVEQAAESAALSRARFEKEALLAADLIGVETRHLEARLRRTFAAADERLALVELRLALGLTPLPQP
jgi:outer membrane protein TolC